MNKKDWTIVHIASTSTQTLTIEEFFKNKKPFPAFKFKNQLIPVQQSSPQFNNQEEPKYISQLRTVKRIYRLRS